MKCWLLLLLVLCCWVMSGRSMKPVPLGKGKGKARGAWAHLQGADPDTVKEAILSERPDLNVQIVPHDAMVTMDMREDRVRLFVKDGKVVRSPRIG